MKEEFYQKKMIQLKEAKIKVEEAKVKALLDIRDALHILTSIGMNFLVVDDRVAPKNYQRVQDAVKETYNLSGKRWAEDNVSDKEVAE